MLCRCADNQQIYPVDNSVDKNIAINGCLFRAITLILCIFAQRDPTKISLTKTKIYDIFY